MSYSDGTINFGSLGALFGGSYDQPQPKTQNNMPQNIHEVAIIQRPTAEQREQGKLDELILAPLQVMAETEKTAIAMAVQKAIEEKKLTRPILPTAEMQVRKFP